MSSYYDQLLKNTQNVVNPFAPQVNKTPEMVLQELKEQKYPEFINTPEGSEAIKELGRKFDHWYNSNYNPSYASSEKELKELKEMVANQAAMMANLVNQVQSLSKPQQQNNHNNHNK